MKKILFSLAAASLVYGASAVADVDLKVGGQAVVYYQTNDAGDNNLFGTGSKALGDTNSIANYGVQLDIGGDLGNGFVLGSQVSYLGTSGLETSIVRNTAQNDGGLNGLMGSTDALLLTQVNIAKVVGNTTVKLGRQELPKSLSPLAFSEGWNVFKNTFDAAVIINSDIPGVTLVGAAVGRANNSYDLGNWNSLQTTGTASAVDGAYMLTAQTSLIPLVTLTASYYALGDLNATAERDSASAIWVDAKLADKVLPLGLSLGLQGGQISPELSALDATTAMGAKLGLSPIDGLGVKVAYSTVNDGAVAMTNTGTGVKTPLYTQLIANQKGVRHDNNTIAAGLKYAFGGTGVFADYSISSDNSAADKDLSYVQAGVTTELSGINLLAAYINSKYGDDDAVSIVRVVARYAF